jgi:ATP-dependent protease ClpP protease subunit
VSSTLGFRIRGEGSETLEIDVYDVIGESWFSDGVTAKDVRKTLKAAPNAKTIKLRVNSGGGDVFDGFVIYNLLAEHGARVVAEVDGLAASMASVILMAADEIHAAKSAMVMIHNPWSFAMGDGDDLRGAADVLDKMRGQIAGVYVARTGLELARVLDMMSAETWMTADEAKEHGFVDYVKPAKKKADDETEKALASLSLRGFERAPAFFAMAIKKARSRVRAETTETTTMSDEELNELRNLLGLADDASGRDIVDAVKALKNAEEDDEEEDEETAPPDEEQARLRAQLEQRDAAYREAIEQRDAARAELAKHTDAEIKDLVDGAIQRDPALGPKRAALEKLARNDRATFEELHGSSGPVPILGRVTQAGAPQGGRRGSAPLSEREELFYRSLKNARVRGSDGKLANDEQLRAMAREKAAQPAQ